jgi:hypothetical protein
VVHRWLRDEKAMKVYTEPIVKEELLKESLYFSCVQACETGDFILLICSMTGDKILKKKD